MNVSGFTGSVEPVDAQVKARQLYWRSRRGLLELELLLVPFMRDCYGELSPETQRSYAKLLESEDLDIYDWLQGRCQPDDESLVPIVALIRRHNDR